MCVNIKASFPQPQRYPKFIISVMAGAQIGFLFSTYYDQFSI